MSLQAFLCVNIMQTVSFVCHSHHFDIRFTYFDVVSQFDKLYGRDIKLLHRELEYQRNLLHLFVQKDYLLPSIHMIATHLMDKATALLNDMENINVEDIYIVLKYSPLLRDFHRLPC